VVPLDERVSDVGLKVGLGPGGETEADTLTVPLKPFWLVTVSVELPDEPCWMLREFGLNVTEKSGVGGACTTKSPTIVEWKVQKYL